MSITVEIDDKDLAKTLQYFDRYEKNRARDIRNIILETAINIDRKAKKFVPIVTGRLEGSIHFERLGNGNTARVFTNVEYASFVEFGTSKQRKQPYMTPAANIERVNYKQRMIQAMRKTR